MPLLKKSEAPRIVNVSSGGGQLEDGADGWAPAYCVSKTALNGVTVQLAAALPNFAINSVCPGWVRTEMGGAGATRSVAEGASGITWLAADAPQDLTGRFIKDRKVIPWDRSATAGCEWLGLNAGACRAREFSLGLWPASIHVTRF